MRSTKLAFVFAVVGCVAGCGASAESPGDSNGSSFSISVEISGLVGGTLVVQDNGTDELSATNDGTFTFATQIEDGAGYDVTVLNEPPGQTCTVTGGSGTAHGDVTATITCSNASFHVGGQLSNVTDTIVLRNNGADDLSLMADGAFVFATPLAFGAPYAVTIKTQPATSSCTVSDGTGNVPAHDVSTVVVACVPSYGVGVTVTGLDGSLTLEDNGTDQLVVTADGTYTFPTRLLTTATYAVTIATQPSGQICSITGDTGMVMTTDVGPIAVTCRNLAVAVNEVYARPATGAFGDTNGDNVRDSSADEFVEIINNETVAVDISGWVILTGSGTPALRFTFPAATTLAAGMRAVVFGGGTPTGSFGDGQVFTSTGLSLTDAPAANFAVQLASAHAGGIVIDTFTYTSTTFGSSCTTTCASQVRSPEGTGTFVSHSSLGQPILWSPGVATNATIPKLNLLLSTPPNAGTNASVLTPMTQFNMMMDATLFDNAHLRLFASPCATLMNEVTAFTSIGPGIDSSKAILTPAAPLAYATVYCLAVEAATSSIAEVALAATATLEFTTRTATSDPSANVVISEVGGCRQSATSGTTACGGTGANDEFVELYNPTAAAIDISGWFVQRRAAGGSATCDATIPAATTLQPGQFYLVGGSGYTASNYANAPAADLVAAGSLVAGGNESVVLIASTGTCTGSSSVVDAVSLGAITDTLATLQLPAMPIIADGTSIERKACYNSTADASTTGMLVGGGHETFGNSERFGANNADWITRPTPNPQNTISTVETAACP